MRRKKQFFLKDASLRKSLRNSIALHLFFVIAANLNFSSNNANNFVAMDVELAGEGCLKDIPEYKITPELVEEKKSELDPPKIVEKSIDDKPEEKIEDQQQNKEPEQPQEQIKEDNNTKDEIEDETKEEKVDDIEDAQPEEKPIPQKDIDNLKKEKEILDKKNEEEKIKKEKELQEKMKKIEKKKKDKKLLIDLLKKEEKILNKKTNKKSLMDAIDKAEKSVPKKSDDVLKNISSSLNSIGSVNGKGSKGTGAGEFGEGIGIEENDIARLAAQIYPNWIVPAAVRDADQFIVSIQFSIKDNGEVITSSIKIIEQGKYKNDGTYKIVADSAVRAILASSPLKIPKDKIDLFRHLVFNFDLKKALRS